tara:strand:+ start:25 stop:483 length:459 start_codon:yes stop_codon:yes gene_type:complete
VVVLELEELVIQLLLQVVQVVELMEPIPLDQVIHLQQLLLKEIPEHKEQLDHFIPVVVEVVQPKLDNQDQLVLVVEVVQEHQMQLQEQIHHTLVVEVVVLLLLVEVQQVPLQEQVLLAELVEQAVDQLVQEIKLQQELPTEVEVVEVLVVIQ